MSCLFLWSRYELAKLIGSEFVHFIKSELWGFTVYGSQSSLAYKRPFQDLFTVMRSVLT